MYALLIQNNDNWVNFHSSWFNQIKCFDYNSGNILCIHPFIHIDTTLIRHFRIIFNYIYIYLDFYKNLFTPLILTLSSQKSPSILEFNCSFFYSFDFLCVKKKNLRRICKWSTRAATIYTLDSLYFFFCISIFCHTVECWRLTSKQNANILHWAYWHECRKLLDKLKFKQQ